MAELSVAEAHERLSDVFRRVEQEKERFYLTRDGKQIAAIIPVEDLAALEAREKATQARADAKEKERSRLKP